MKLQRLGIALVALGLICCSQSAKAAAELNEAIRIGGNNINDIDRERLIDNDGDGLVSEGDFLEAVLYFDNITNSSFAQTPIVDAVGNPTYQLTAYSQIEVIGKSDNGDGTFDFTFGNGFGDGTAIRVYEDDVTQLDFNTAASVAAAVAAATDGSLILTLGLAELGDFWRANDAVDNLDLFDTADAFLAFQFGLSVIDNPGDIKIQNEGRLSAISGTTHDVTGGGTVEGIVGAKGGWDVATNTSVVFNAVPEPTAIATWSLLMGSAAVLGLRRRRAKLAA